MHARFHLTSKVSLEFFHSISAIDTLSITRNDTMVGKCVESGAWRANIRSFVWYHIITRVAIVAVINITLVSPKTCAAVTRRVTSFGTNDAHESDQ